MDAPRREARARVARAAKAARRAAADPDAAAELTNARRDYAAASLAEYIAHMVDDWPPLTCEQVAELRALFDPVGRRVA
jgi:hypothetical protein